MHNRRFFDEALKHYVAEFSKIGKPLALLMIDLDHFKAINDTYGHDVGDEVLRSVAFCLFELTRFHDVVARFGGEEFAIIAPDLSEDETFRFAERLREKIAAQQIHVGPSAIRITASLGCTIALPQDNPTTILKRADGQLYEAKRAGRNRVAS
ncbi:GGDEF domain-containing protein [Jiella sp. MQZ9-1]|nr:GGDEF domain-containing protein [Jiella flava]MCD2471903.1 GGDEF domain-containing protein [Jiella flava]